VTTEIVGYDELMRRLERLKAKARDASPAFDEAADLALRSVDKNFEVGGRPAWTPHAPATLRQMIGPRRLLIESGALRDSMKKKVGATSASVFPTDKKAAWHQFGTEVHGKPHIPPRPFLLLQAEDVPAIGDRFEEFFSS
jgi:phage gpG-like protein